jgi:hypothetical protein
MMYLARENLTLEVQKMGIEHKIEIKDDAPVYIKRFPMPEYTGTPRGQCYQ